MLPVGTKMADGSFGFTADQVSNSWTMVNGQPVPLDANGNPFNPKTSPDKILWKNYAYIPKEAFEIDIQNIFVGSLMVTQPIYLGGKIRELNKIANASKRIAESQQNSELSDLYAQIDEIYWRIVSLSSKKKLAESYVNLLAKLDDNMDKSIDAGLATKADGLSVKVKRNEADMILAQVNNGLSLSKMQLAQLCGISYEEKFDLVGRTDT